MGMSDSQVRLLQRALNALGFTIAKSGAGSPGKETNYFGPATRLALIRFQEANAKSILTPLGLTKGTGKFAAGTRAFIAELLKR
jgi:peptidoglycan hydrolase-like protein with peptidoglycan-binding domain